MKSKFFRFLTKNAAFVALFVFLGTLVIGEKAFPEIEEKTDAYFTETVSEAATVFATARVINGGISVIKDSTVTVTPFGLGTEIALGQVLDPLDDVIERLSDILFTVIVALGIQKAVYEIIGATAVYGIGTLLALSLLLALCFRNERLRAWSVFLKKAALLLLFVRVALPCSALISETVETHFFAPKIAACQARLSVFEAESKIRVAEQDSLWDKAGKMKEQLQEKLKLYWENAMDMVEVALEIAGHYIALFLVQVIFIPLGMFWLLVKITNRFFSTALPEIIPLAARSRESDGGPQ